MIFFPVVGSLRIFYKGFIIVSPTFALIWSSMQIIVTLSKFLRFYFLLLSKFYLLLRGASTAWVMNSSQKYKFSLCSRKITNNQTLEAIRGNLKRHQNSNPGLLRSETAIQPLHNTSRRLNTGLVFFLFIVPVGTSLLDRKTIWFIRLAFFFLFSYKSVITKVSRNHPQLNSISFHVWGQDSKYSNWYNSRIFQSWLVWTVPNAIRP